MTEFYSAPSGEWNLPANMSSSAEVAKELPRSQILAENNNMFGKPAVKPNAFAVHVDDTTEQKSPKGDENGETPAVPKKTNPFV